VALPSRLAVTAAVTTAVVAAALVGCGSGSPFKNNDEAQALIGKRIVGMQAGDFFQTFGRPRSRTEQPDGSALYLWESAVGSTPPGPFGEDERICRLRVMADKRGRIEGASVLADFQGRTSTSRCSELFR